MDIQTKDVNASGIKLFVTQDGKEVGRAYLYLMTNDLHERPFGFMEDVFVDDSLRGGGIGTALVNAVVQEAKKRNCYKLIATSRYARPKVHELYVKLGWSDHGKEFRIDFE
jgi:GNAT superfamily N-acetyltransferase